MDAVVRTLLFHTPDLLWSTRIESTAAALGIPCAEVASVAALDGWLSGDLPDSPAMRPCAVVLDLGAGEVAFALLGRLRAEGAGEAFGEGSGARGLGPGSDAPAGRIPVVVFGSHVDHAALERARAGGADQVLARGAFDRQLPEILRALVGASSPPVSTS